MKLLWLLGMSLSQACIAAPNLFASLEGMSYVNAKKELQKRGWLPLNQHREKTFSQTSSIWEKIPELIFCAADVPYCHYAFHNKSGCAIVIAKYEEQEIVSDPGTVSSVEEKSCTYVRSLNSN